MQIRVAPFGFCHFWDILWWTMADVKGDPDVVFVFTADDRRIPAHRGDLSRASPYFAKMFARGSRDSGQREVKLNDVNYDIFQTLVDDCYFRDFVPSEKNAHHFLLLANGFQFMDVLQKCCDFISKRLTPENCLGIIDLAERLGLEELLTKSFDYFHWSFMETIKHKEYLDLSYDRLRTLLSSDDLNVRSEEQVYQAMLDWINHAFAERINFFPNLLELIRLPHLSTAFINGSVRQLASSSGCQHLLEETINFKMMPAKRAEIAKRIRIDGRHCAQKIIAIGRAFNDERKLFIELYCPATNSWTLLKTLDIVLCRLTATITDDHRVIVAGDSESVCPGVIIDLTTKSEVRLPPMNNKRQNFAVGYLDGCIYVTGGMPKGYYDEATEIDTVERFDPRTGAWQFVAPMLEERYNHAVAALDGVLYAAGGGASCSPKSNTLECYDPERNVWTRRAPMIRKRTNLYLTVCDWFLYAIGGSAFNYSKYALADCCNTIERYDPKTNEWTMIIKFFATDRQHHNFEGAILSGHSLYAIGGQTNQKHGRDDRDGDVVKICLREADCKRLAPLEFIRKDVFTVTVPNSVMIDSE